MASNLRVDNIQPSTGMGIGIGTANGSIYFNSDINGGMNIATGSVGIGTTPEAFHSNNKGVIRGDGGYFILGRNTNDSLYIAQNFYYDSSDAGRYIVDGEASLYAQDNGEHVFYGAASGNANNVASQQERARFTSSGLKLPSGLGIDFSATANTTISGSTMTSELLDDYEEGTWTPILLGSTSESGQTYGGQEGQYTKIGNMVFLRYKLYLTAAGTFTGTYCLLGGFPFVIQGSSSGGVNTVGDGIVYHVNLVNSVYLLALQQLENDNKAYFWNKNTLSASRQYYNGSQMFANNTEISGTVCYQTSS